MKPFVKDLRPSKRRKQDENRIRRRQPRQLHQCCPCRHVAGNCRQKLGFTAVNHAAGGRLTILMRGMFCSDALAEAPDGVFIQCGINDVLLDEPLER